MKLNAKRLSSLLLVMLLLVSLFSVTVFAVETESVTVLDIYHTNDMHARVANYPLIAGIVNANRANTLLLDAGDTLHGQSIATLEKGSSIVSIMNAVGYDAMTPGNHDFNYGITRLLELEKTMNFDLLSANLMKDDKLAFAAYKILTVGNYKIAVIGASTPETAYKTHPDNIKGYLFDDVVKRVSTAVSLVESQSDAIIVLAHIGLDPSSIDQSTALAAIKGVDLVIDGHSHSNLPEGQKTDNALIASTGEYGDNLGHVQMSFDADKNVTVTASLIDLKAQAALEAGAEGYVAPDASIAKIIADIEAGQKPLLDEVVGNTAVDLVGEREIVRAGMSNLGNLITASMISETGADIALTNGGGIRASIPAGNITRGQVLTVLPFGNFIVTKEIPGKDIVAALELGLSAYPETLGGFPHYAGMSVVFDPSAAAGSRVFSVTVADKPIELEKKYVFATNDFMAAGGDNYVMFGDYPILNEYGSLDEAVITYLENGGAVPALDDRLSARTPVVTTPDATAPEVTPPEIIVPVPSTSTVITYVVVDGDTLSKIAKKYNTDWKILYELNKGTVKNPNLIYIGQTLVVSK